MDFTETVSAGYIRQAAKIQTIVQLSVRCEGAERVLAVSAGANVRVSETLNGEVRLSGREALEAVVMTEDGMRRVSGWAEFSDRAEAEGITPTSRTTAYCRVLDTDVVSVGGGNATFASVVEIIVYEERTCMIPPAPASDDEVFTGSESVTLSCVQTSFSGRAEAVSRERFNITEVVCAFTGVVINGTEAALDAVYVNGEFTVDGIGKTRDGGIAPFSFEVPFSTEIAAEGARRGGCVFVRTGGASVIGELTDEGMLFTAIVEICGEVYAETETQCVTDAFGPDREITMTSACVEGLKVTGAHCVKDKAEGTVTLPSGDNADKITAIVGFGLTSLTVYAEGGKAVAEGAVSGYVIYADAEAGRRSSCLAEIPFRIVTDVEADDNCELDISGSVGRVAARSARSGEIAVRCELSLCILTADRVHKDVVTSITCGEAKPDRTGVISMHSASEGETLWESAKALSVRPETVMSQNPSLVYPLKKGEKVFVFREKKAEA